MMMASASTMGMPWAVASRGSCSASLRAASTLGGKRNVLKRFERTALLEKRGQRKAGDKITSLRKTKPEA